MGRKAWSDDVGTTIREPAWTLIELLVVVSLFLVASLLLFTIFDRQASFSERNTIEALKNALRDAALREMREQTGNGYVALDKRVQGFSYVQGGQLPYRITTPLAGATPPPVNTDQSASQTTFTFAVEKYGTNGYAPLAGTALGTGGEGLTLVYYPEGKNENTITSGSTQSPYATDNIARSALGSKTTFYLRKNNLPVSNRLEFVSYNPKNVTADDASDVKPTITAGTGGGDIQRLNIAVSRLGNFSPLDNLSSGSTTYTVQMKRAGANVGSPINLPSDIW